MAGIKEECGIFGIASPPGSNLNPAYETYIGLFSLQHRGQEAAGIAVNDSGIIDCFKGVGLLTDVFTKEKIESMKGNSAIGHVRYSTTGASEEKNAQPISVSHIKGNLAIAHNGNLTNSSYLREKIELEGGIFHTTSDSEIIAYEIVRERLNTSKIEEAVKLAMANLKGAYSMLVMSPKKVVAARDPAGFRPLVIGKLGKHFVFASETCAIDVIGGKYLRDVKPGEIVVCENDKIKSIDSGLKETPAFCCFEHIYLSRPDSIFAGFGMEEARNLMGKSLAKNYPVKADIVVPVPESGIPAANGFAEESGIPLGTGLIKNRYVARTFISPTTSERGNQVRLKLNPLKESIKGKSVVLIDDSIVRGTTSKNIVSAIREAGAKKIHMRVSSPPFKHPCFFGIDVPDKEKLIANNNTVFQMKKVLKLDSLAFLSVLQLNEIFRKKKIGICDGCFSGKYPTEIPSKKSKNVFERKIKLIY